MGALSGSFASVSTGSLDSWSRRAVIDTAVVFVHEFLKLQLENRVTQSFFTCRSSHPDTSYSVIFVCSFTYKTMMSDPPCNTETQNRTPRVFPSIGPFPGTVMQAQ